MVSPLVFPCCQREILSCPFALLTLLLRHPSSSLRCSGPWHNLEGWMSSGTQMRFLRKLVWLIAAYQWNSDSHAEYRRSLTKHPFHPQLFTTTKKEISLDLKRLKFSVSVEDYKSSCIMFQNKAEWLWKNKKKRSLIISPGFLKLMVLVQGLSRCSSQAVSQHFSLSGADQDSLPRGLRFMAASQSYRAFLEAWCLTSPSGSSNAFDDQAMGIAPCHFCRTLSVSPVSHRSWGSQKGPAATPRLEPHFLRDHRPV